MGSDNYKIRDHAFRQLARDPPIHMLLLSEQSKDCEIASRSRKLVDLWYRNRNLALIENIKIAPWIIDEYQGQYYLQRARKEIGMQDPPEWNDYRLATRIMLSELYREDPNEIISRLRQAEYNWIAVHGNRYSSPIPMVPDPKKLPP